MSVRCGIKKSATGSSAWPEYCHSSAAARPLWSATILNALQEPINFNFLQILSDESDSIICLPFVPFVSNGASSVPDECFWVWVNDQELLPAFRVAPFGNLQIYAFVTKTASTQEQLLCILNRPAKSVENIANHSSDACRYLVERTNQQYRPIIKRCLITTIWFYRIVVIRLNRISHSFIIPVRWKNRINRNKPTDPCDLKRGPCRLEICFANITLLVLHWITHQRSRCLTTRVRLDFQTHDCLQIRSGVHRWIQTHQHTQTIRVNDSTIELFVSNVSNATNRTNSLPVEW